MRIAVFSRYSDLGASSRVRTMNYVPYALSRNINLVFFPLISNQTLTRRYLKKSIMLQVLFSYACRASMILMLRLNIIKFDGVLVEKEFFPYLPLIFEKFIIGRINYAVDFDDAIFHNYDFHRFYLIRWMLRKKIPSLVKQADLVICGSHYLYQKTHSMGAAQIKKIPSVVDDWCHPIKDFRLGIKKVGWIGSPTTFQYLEPLLELLDGVCGDLGLTLFVMGPNKKKCHFSNVEWLDWSIDAEKDFLRAIDVGLSPLFDGPWENGKCGYKIIQYFSAGVVPIVSPVGENKIIVDDKVDGFFAGDAEEWATVLRELSIMQPAKLKKIQKNGYQKFKSNYSLDSQGQEFVSSLFSTFAK